MTGSGHSAVGSVSVVVPTYNGRRWLSPCLDSVLAQSLSCLETVVVDDGSDDGTVAFLEERYAPRAPRVRVVVMERNLGFAAAVNRGIAASTGRYVLLLNNDTEMRAGCLEALARAIEAAPADVAAVQAKMLRRDDPGRIDDAGDQLFWTFAASKAGHGEPAASYRVPREIFSPCAGATLYRRSFLEELGGFDERFFAYFEDVDLGFRGRLRGYRYLYEPTAEVLHEGQGSGLPRARYVRLMTRNRLLVLAKNVPFTLFLRHLPSILYGQIWFVRAYGLWLDSFYGYGAFVAAFPHALSERRRIQSSRRVSVQAIDGMLSRGMPR